MILSECILYEDIEGTYTITYIYITLNKLAKTGKHKNDVSMYPGEVKINKDGIRIKLSAILFWCKSCF